MWICPECNTSVNDENVSCEVCGATRKAPPRHDSTLFSSGSESLKSRPVNGLRNDLACVVVRGFGLYLVVEALLSAPNSIATIVAANEFGKVSLNVDAISGTGTFSSLLVALFARNVLMFFGGLFFLFSDLMVRLLARPTKS
jgi:hypothetical protein